MNPTQTFYIVWGPTAEWADGSGPLAYFASRTDAEAFITNEVASVALDGMTNTWPYNVIGYAIQETTAAELDVPIRMLGLTEERFFEELNAP